MAESGRERVIPPDVIHEVCLWVAASGDPASPDHLVDPHLELCPAPMYTFSPTYESRFAPSPTRQAQATLKTLCLVSRAWREEARPLLWSLGVRFGMPRGFETVVKIVDPIGQLFDGNPEPDWLMTPPASRQASPLRSRQSMSPRRGDGAAMERRRSEDHRGRSISVRRSLAGDVILEGVGGRSVSPPRGRTALESIHHTLRHVSISPGPRKDEYVFRPDVDDLVNPGPVISSISFSAFRTQGLRRTVGEGTEVRFITPERVLRLLRATRRRTDESSTDTMRQGKLRSVGFSEYMDSAISKEVLEELLFRGGVWCTYEVEDGWERPPAEEDDEPEGRGRQRRRDVHPPIHGRHHGPSKLHELGDEMDVEPEPAAETHFEGREESNLSDETPLVALDLCACTSSKFSDGLSSFLASHNLPSGAPPLTSHATGGPGERLYSTTFWHLRRLGLANVTVDGDLLRWFVMSFRCLTHLDLTGTRAERTLLAKLRVNGLLSREAPAPSRFQLKALALGKCRLLSERDLLGYLCGPASATDHWAEPFELSTLEELSLAGTPTHPTDIGLDGARRLVDSAIFASALLVTLDLSSIQLDDSILERMPAQPRLVQLGLAHCPLITLSAVAALLEQKAANVEVLDLAGSCGSSRSAVRPGTRALPPMSTTDLHGRLVDLVARPSFAISGSRNASGWDGLDGRKTKLRVVELDEATLNAIQGGGAGWKVVWGKGQRGWYVDTTVAVKVRDGSRELVPLARDDPRRKALDLLSELKGIVASDVGWFSKKMEILDCGGYLARQEGLYAFHAYARS